MGEGHIRKRCGYWLAAVAAMAAVAAATGAVAQLARWKIDSAAAQRGQQLFVSNCAFCHGADARGSERAPDLVESSLVNDDEHGELIGDLLSKGRPGRGMPAFPALAGQAGDVANFLHGRIADVMNRFGYKIAAGMSGDAQAGEQFFNGAGGCKDCHSTTGDLAHVGTKYKPDVLEGAIAFPGPALLHYIGIDLRPMSSPPISVTVTPLDGKTVTGTAVFIGEYDVSLRTANGAYRSFSRTTDLKIEIHDPLEGHRKLLTRYSDTDLHNLVAYLMELK